MVKGIAVKKKTIYLHIGHGKTGTTATQSAFSLAAEELEKSGFLYPVDTIKNIKNNCFEITGGNWKHDPNKSISQQLQDHIDLHPNFDVFIISSESLFWQIHTLLENIEEWDHQFELKIILAVRDVEEMLSSEYQQRIKRHGEKRPYEQFLRSRKYISSHHKRAAYVLKLLESNQIKSFVFNYSKNKLSISEIIFKAINVINQFPREKMQGMIINRSLSQKELQFLLMINALYYEKYPWISAALSDSLAEQLPNVQSQTCRLSPNSRKLLYETNDLFIEEINKFLDNNQELKRLKDLAELTEPEKSPEYNQRIKLEEASSIRVISEALLDALKKGNPETVQPHQKIIEHQFTLENPPSSPNKIEKKSWKLANYFHPKKFGMVGLVKTYLFTRNLK